MPEITKANFPRAPWSDTSYFPEETLIPVFKTSSGHTTCHGYQWTSHRETGKVHHAWGDLLVHYLMRSININTDEDYLSPSLTYFLAIFFKKKHSHLQKQWQYWQDQVQKWYSIISSVSTEQTLSIELVILTHTHLHLTH